MFRNQKIIFVMGGPGSGKGTHCDLMKEKYHYHHISTGELVRAKIDAAKEAKDLSEDSIKIREMTNAGTLLPDKFISDLLIDEMKNNPEAKGFLIDGFPRTLEQAVIFETLAKPYDKVIFFNTTEEIMTARMLARGREDDTPKTIQKRIKTFNDLTLPTIDYFKDKEPSKFKEIDSSGTVEKVEEMVEAALYSKPKMANVGFFELASLYWTSGNFCDAVKELEKRYSTSEFKVSFSLLPFIPALYILQDRENVNTALNANTNLSYQYHNADLAHGHKLNILAIQAFNGPQDMSHNPLWEAIHKGLSVSVAGDKELVSKLIDKHIPILFSRETFMLDIQFEKFMLAFWCDYMFGGKVNVDEFSRTRHKLLETMRYAYYGNSLKNVPFKIGEATCRFYGWMKSVEFAQIDKELQQYIDNADSGLMHRFKENLLASMSVPHNQIDQVVLDNTFDLVLVFDFLHNALYETLATIVKNQLANDKERRDSYAYGLRSAFLFPFRSRDVQRSFTLNGETIAKGSMIYVNLVKSGLYHAASPRACIGQGVTGWVKNRVFDHLKDIQLTINDTTMPEERAAMCHCADVPMTPERYEVSWSYRRNHLQNQLSHFPFKGLNKFYDVLETFQDPQLTGYIVASFVEQIEKSKIDKSQLIIIAPEMRGIPIAAMVARDLRIPLVFIRKPGMIPGPILNSGEYSNAYAKGTGLEIASNDKLKEKVKGKEVILIDDGIASGGTTKTCCNLVETLGGRISLILAMINHTYETRGDEFKTYEDRVHTVFDFDSDKVKLAKDAVKMEEVVEKPVVTLGQ